MCSHLENEFCPLPAKGFLQVADKAAKIPKYLIYICCSQPSRRSNRQVPARGSNPQAHGSNSSHVLCVAFLPTLSACVALVPLALGAADVTTGESVLLLLTPGPPAVLSLPDHVAQL